MFLRHTNNSQARKYNKAKKQKTSSFKKLISFIGAFFSSFTTQQLVAILFLLMLATALAYDLSHNQPVIKKDPDDNDDEDKSLAAICEAKPHALNKPDGIKLGARAGAILPFSCLLNQTNCNEELMTFNEMTGNPRLRAYRKAAKEEFNTWEFMYSKVIKSIASDFKTKQQLRIFTQSMTFIRGLKQIHLGANIYNLLGEGNCAEINYSALLKILRLKKETYSKMVVQLVEMETNTSDRKNIIDHIVLLIDKKGKGLPEINIIDSPAKVEELLDFIKNSEVKLCDPWNEGHFVSIKDDQTNFYGKQGMWSSLCIRTINLDFAALGELPVTARQFVCEQLAQFELVSENQSFCPGFFA